MERVRLGDIIQQIRGVSYKSEDISPIQDDKHIPVLRANNISNGKLNFEDLVFINKEKIKENQIVRKNDIIIATSSGSINIIGKAAQSNSDLNMSFGAFCKLIRIKDTINKKYIGHYFQSINYRRRISKLANGANINNIKNEHIDDLFINIPDAQTQNKIVEILDKIQSLIDKRKEQIIFFDTLVKSRFIDMFENKQRKELYKFAEITMGQSPLSEYYNYNGLGFPFYQGKVEFGDVFVRKTKTWCTKPTKFAKPNDILISVRAPVGSVNIAFEECCIGRGLASITPIENKLESLYLFYALKIKENEISKLGVGSTFKAINKQQVLDLLIPDAEIDEQRNFADFVKSIDKSKFGHFKESLKLLNLLKKPMIYQ